VRTFNTRDPNAGACFNVAKETTHKEMCSIDGVSESTQRQQGINLSAGFVNATEFCTDMYGLPSMDEMLIAFQNQRTIDTPVLSDL